MTNSFIEKMAVLYQVVPSPILVSVRLAQACLESSFGQSELARNARNFAGIKASSPWIGETYTKLSDEEIYGQMKLKLSEFRKYESVEEFVKDHSNFFTSTQKRAEEVYKQAIEATTHVGQCAGLTGTYATDSEYGAKLIQIIEDYNLTQFDRKEDIGMIMQPKYITKNLLPEDAMGAVLGVIIHNDYGSKNGTVDWYLDWLSRRDKTLGIAHYYITKNTIGRFVDTYRIAYHAGNWSANSGGYIGYEVCQSRWDNGVSTEEFLFNEDMTLRQAAEDMLFYKLPVNRQTVRLHQEFSSTTCPHRSWDLYGKSVNSVKDYFITKIKYYQSLGKTVKEMIDAENAGKAPKPKEIKKAEVDARNVTIPKYVAPKNPFAEQKVGATVTIRPGQTYWYVPSTKGGVKPSKDFAGTKAAIEQVMSVEAGYSKRAYLLKELKSWILEQDLVEPRANWVKLAGEEAKENTSPNVISSNEEGVFYLKGVKYMIKEVK